MQPYLWMESMPGEWPATSRVSYWLFVPFTIRPEWWRQYVRPKCQLSALLHDVLLHKTEPFILTAVAISESTMKILITQQFRDSVLCTSCMYSQFQKPINGDRLSRQVRNPPSEGKAAKQRKPVCTTGGLPDPVVAHFGPGSHPRVLEVNSPKAQSQSTPMSQTGGHMPASKDVTTAVRCHGNAVPTLPNRRYTPTLAQRPTVPQLKWLLCFAGLHTSASDVCDPTWWGVAMSGSSLMKSSVFVWLSLKRSLGILLFRAVVNVCWSNSNWKHLRRRRILKCLFLK